MKPGETLGGRYIIGTVLGYGGFGVTYRAWDSMLSTVVAVKEFYPSGLVSRIPGEKSVVVFSGEKAESYKSQLLRFLDEARNMAKFSSDPHIVGVYDFYQENNTAYIIMEYLDGQTLKAYMAQVGGRLPEEEAVRFITPILEAIASIHSKKIIHRDISPDNIFVLRDGRIKLLDFGAARFSENPEGLTSTVIIKPGYAPPEQYRSKMKQGPWTDLYAAGATLYKMLTGVTPSESVDRMEKDELKPPSELVLIYEPALDRITMKSMALAPELRFRKASDFIDAINGRREVELPEIEQKKRSKRRILGGAFSVAAALVLLIVTVLLTSNNSGSSNPPPSIEARPETITILARESEKALFETLVSRYSQEFDEQTVQLSIAPDDGYENMLAELILSGDAPTLFRTGEAGPDGHAAPLDELIKALAMREYLFLPDYESLFPGKTQIPLTFFTAVCYANTTFIPSLSSPPPDALRSPDEFFGLGADNAMVDPEALGAYLAVCYPDIMSDGRLNLRDDTTDGIVRFVRFFESQGFGAGSDPVGLFYDDGLPYLISSTARLRDVQRELPGYYDVLPIHNGITGVYGLDNLWSVSASASENQQVAGQQFLVFMLGEYAQNMMCVQNNAGIPINRKVFAQFLDINSDLAYLANEVESGIALYAELPALRRFADDLTRSVLDAGMGDGEIAAWLEGYDH